MTARKTPVSDALEPLPVDPVPAEEWPVGEEQTMTGEGSPKITIEAPGPQSYYIDSPDLPTIQAALAAVMADVVEIGKNQRNTDQNYSFRGIDDYYNAMHGPMSEHGVVMLPDVLKVETSERRTSTGKAMYHCLLTVSYTFVGPAGDRLSVVVVGEGQDTQDKAVTKALSAAHKYALQQVFMPPIEAQIEADHGSEDTVFQPNGIQAPVDPDENRWLQRETLAAIREAIPKLPPAVRGEQVAWPVVLGVTVLNEDKTAAINERSGRELLAAIEELAAPATPDPALEGFSDEPF